eukprot:scaffold1120_cov57-Phaeocystis_antarctica.AAC.3
MWLFVVTQISWLPVQTRCRTHAAARLLWPGAGLSPCARNTIRKAISRDTSAASMQDTLSERTARAAQLAPSVVTASAVGGSATRSGVAESLVRRRAARRGARAIARRGGGARRRRDSKSMPGYPAASSGSEKVPKFAPMSMKLPPAASSCIMSPMILRRVRSLPACAHEPVSSSPLEMMWFRGGVHVDAD